jgi:hypothetical protein
MKRKSRTFDDNTAKNIESTSRELEKYRNELFGFIINTGIYFHATLLVDYANENLVCGQVGEIQDVIIDKNENSYYLIFTDFQSTEGPFAYCLVKKKHLLPLFYFDPKKDENIEITMEVNGNKRTTTLEKTRNELEEAGLVNILENSNNGLINHSKALNRFQIGRLVTIQADFEQKVSDNESFTIQAGQVGIISGNVVNDNDAVEVTFFSMPLGELVRKQEKLLSFFANQNPDSFANKALKEKIYKKIHIDKDFLFPLYCEKCTIL